MAEVTACPSCGTKNRVPVAASGRPRCAKCHADLAWLVDAGDADFAAAVDAPGLVLVDFWAPWCGPCRTVAPVLERLASRYAGRLKVVKVDVDRSPVVSARFGIQSIPALALLHGGREVDRVIGAQPEHVLAARVEQHLSRGATAP